MNKFGSKVVSPFLYFLCAVSLLVFLYIDFFGVSLTRGLKIIITASVFLFAYLASLLKCTEKPTDTACNIMYNTFFFLFTVYIVVIVDFTLIDGAFGRNISVFFTKDSETRREFLQNGVNLIPFATIRLFISGFKNGALNLSDIIENILGNFLVFAPMAFFVPIYLIRINRFYKYLLFITLTVLLIELLQIFFMTGAADVDDVLLNVSGAAVFYGIVRIKPVGKGLKSATFTLWETE